MVEAFINGCKIRMVVGDLTVQDTDAIVNAANSSLMGGGGVDGAIHRAGGPEILEECKIIRQKQGKLPTGEAVITTGGKLKANYVIHTVGPVWYGGDRKEAKKLANAYKNSLILAVKNNIKRISFPSISTGAYRFPIEKAASIALKTIKDFLIENEVLTEVRMVLHTQKDFQVYLNAWENVVINNKN